MPLAISILSMITGILGVIVAGIAVYVTSKSRIEPYKLSVHTKQTDAALEIIEALIDCKSTVSNFYYSVEPDNRYISESIRKEYRNALLSTKNELRKKITSWAIILPPEVLQPLVHYLSILEYSMGERDVMDPWAGASYPKDEPWMFLSRYFHKSVIEVRRFMGIEPLGLELSKTFKDIEKLENGEEDIADLDNRNILLVYLFSKEYVPYGSYGFLESIRNPEKM